MMAAIRRLASSDSDATRADVAEVRASVERLTVVVAAQHERLSGQAAEIEKAHELIRALRTVEAQLRGDLREAYSRISGLESQLSEERSARTSQANEAGFMKAQLQAADERLKHQRDELTDQAKKIAVLENELAKYQGLYAGTALAKTALEADLVAARAEVSGLTSQLQAIQDEVAKLRRPAHGQAAPGLA